MKFSRPLSPSFYKILIFNITPFYHPINSEIIFNPALNKILDSIWLVQKLSHCTFSILKISIFFFLIPLLNLFDNTTKKIQTKNTSYVIFFQTFQIFRKTSFLRIMVNSRDKEVLWNFDESTIGSNLIEF